MFALVGIFHGAPEHLDDAIRRGREQTLPALQLQPGFAGLYSLVDRQTGKGIGISFWETEAALQAWELTRRPIIADHEVATGRTVQELARYEVVISPEMHSMPAAPLTGADH